MKPVMIAAAAALLANPIPASAHPGHGGGHGGGGGGGNWGGGGHAGAGAGGWTGSHGGGWGGGHVGGFATGYRPAWRGGFGGYRPVWRGGFAPRYYGGFHPGYAFIGLGLGFYYADWFYGPGLGWYGYPTVNNYTTVYTPAPAYEGPPSAAEPTPAAPAGPPPCGHWQWDPAAARYNWIDASCQN